MLRSAENGEFFIEPISKELSHSIGYSFVDNTDLIQFDIKDQKVSKDEVLERMQNSINRWEGGFKSTGGTIVPQKSFVYPIIFKFDAAWKWHYEKVENIDYSFTVLDHNDTLQIMEQLDTLIGKCTPGVHLVLVSNNSAAIQNLRKKSAEWSKFINSGHLNRTDAWLVTQSTIMKSLIYP